MKAFLWAVVACVAISAGAGFVLTSQSGMFQGARVAEGVRLH